MGTAAIGFIYPDHAAEDDYQRAAELLSTADLDVVAHVRHIYGTDLHAVPELLELGSPGKLRDGAAQLAAVEPDSVVWACTSGSFVYGTDGARTQVETLAADAGAPASSTSFAFVNAAQAMGVRRVAVAASYPADIAALFERFLAAHGIDVIAIGCAGIDTAAEVGTLRAGEVTELVVGNDDAGADAVFVPDTAMHTIDVLPELEAAVGKPVLTANQVTVWEGLRISGHLTHSVQARSGLGRLFDGGAAGGRA